MQRRDLFRRMVAGAALAASARAAACVRLPPERDTLGEQLLAFLRNGDPALLDDLLHEEATLVAFEPGWLPDEGQSVGGAAQVAAALRGLREMLASDGLEGARRMVTGTITGSDEAGSVRRILAEFAEDKTTYTSCGPTRSELRLQLHYRTTYTVLSAGDRVWGMLRIAIMPLAEAD